MIETKDGALLCSYMSEHYEESASQDETAYLAISMRIMKIRICSMYKEFLKENQH